MGRFNLARRRCSRFNKPTSRAVIVTLVARPSVRYEKVGPGVEHSKMVVNFLPGIGVGRSRHRQLGAGGIAAGRLVVRRSPLIFVHWMCKSRRTEPVSSRPECSLASAALAIFGFSHFTGVYRRGRCESAIRALVIEPPPLPGIVPIALDGRVDSPCRQSRLLCPVRIAKEQQEAPGTE